MELTFAAACQYNTMTRFTSDVFYYLLLSYALKSTNIYFYKQITISAFM